MSNRYDELDDEFYDDEDYYSELSYDEEIDDSYEYEDNIVEDRDYDYEYDNDYDDYVDEEETHKNKFNILNHLKTIIIILNLIVILLIIFFCFRKNKSNNIKDKNDDDITVIKNNINTSNQMFKRIKDITLNYYNEENIQEGENILTLNDMKNKSLIDNVASSYNLDESKAVVVKDKSKYQLNIDLVNNDKTESKSYNIDKYIYCKTYLCERSIKEEKKKYEYTKDNDPIISEWSNWSDYEETECDISEVSCDENDSNCLTEIKIDKKEISLGIKDMVYQTSRSAFKTLNKEVSKVCSNYDYIKINDKYYRTENNSNFKLLGNIKKSTQNTYYNWKYNGRKSYEKPPTDTINNRYVFVEADFSKCGKTCDDKLRYVYDSYTFTKQLVNVSNPALDCSNSKTKVVANFSIEPQKITVSRKEDATNTLCYKSVRTRTLTQTDKSVKWSNYNDQELLSSGYSYTGNNK